MTGNLRPHMAELTQNLPNAYWLEWSKAASDHPVLVEAVMMNDLGEVLGLLKKISDDPDTGDDYTHLAEEITRIAAADRLSPSS